MFPNFNQARRKKILHEGNLFHQIKSSISGVLFGSISVVENICNLTSSVMAGAIYSETVSFYRGTAYLVFGGLMTVAFLLLL